MQIKWWTRYFAKCRVSKAYQYWDFTDVLEEIEGKIIVAVRGRPLLYNPTSYWFIAVISDMADAQSNTKLAWRCLTHNSNQNTSLKPLRWAVSMGRVSTEMLLRSIGYTYNQSEQLSMLFVENKFNQSTLWWRGWLRYCWSSVHHRIKPTLTIWLVRTAPVQTYFFPNRATPDPTSRQNCFVGKAKLGWQPG